MPLLFTVAWSRCRSSALASKVRTLSYIVTTHTVGELDADKDSILDLGNLVRTDGVLESQRDRHTLEIKRYVQGGTPSGDRAEAVTKVGATGRLVFIAVYRC
jgi:hypothetical protein